MPFTLSSSLHLLTQVNHHKPVHDGNYFCFHSVDQEIETQRERLSNLHQGHTAVKE